MDYAKTLGIRRDADAKEIKQAYVKLIKQFRPDSHPIEFGEIREAYEIALKQLEWDKSNNQHEIIEEENSPIISIETISVIEDVNVFDKNENNINLPNLDFAIFLKCLNELAQSSSESASKELTSTYLSTLNKTSLDEMFNIEIELLTWIFNTDKPLLLAFIQIDDIFRWTKTGAYTVRNFSEWEMEKLFFLRQLAETYNKAIEEKDSNLVSEERDSWKFIESISNVSQRKEWHSLTHSLGYAHLKNYFKPPENNKFQIVWSDLIVASMFGAIGFFVASYNNFSHAYLMFFGVFISSFVIKIYLGSYVSTGLKNIKTLVQQIDQRHTKVRDFLRSYKFKYGYVIIIISILLVSSLLTFGATQNKFFHWLSLIMFSVVGLIGVIIAAAVLVYLLSALLVIFLALPLAVANAPYTIAYSIEHTCFRLFKFFQTSLRKSYPWTLVSSDNDVKKRRHWQKVCEDFGYESLKNYFKPPPRSKFSITWTDIFCALSLSQMYWIFTSEIDNVTVYINAFILFVLAIIFNVFLAPFIVRRFKYNYTIKNYKVIVICVGLLFLVGFLSNHIPANLESKVSMCKGIQSTESPIYPTTSRIHQEEGKILLELIVGIDGSVVSAKLVKSSGFVNLDKAALDKAKTWCFVPQTENGVPRQVTVRAPISFKLD